MGARSSRRKILLRVVLALGGVFVLALILIPVLVPAEKWQQIAFDRLQKETGLVASAESAGVSIFPLGLSLKGLQVRDPENRPEWSGLELDLNEAVVRASLRPLFSGRFEAAQVTLKQPRLILTPVTAPESAEGEGEAGAPAKQPAPMSIALAAISVEDAYVELNQPDGSQLALFGLTNLSALNIQGERGDATAEGGLDSLRITAPDAPAETVRDLDWDLVLDFAADGSGGTAEVKQLEIPGLKSHGEVKWESGEAMGIDARLRIAGDVARLAQEWFEPRRGTIEWPEGIGSADVQELHGSFEGDLTFAGTLEPGAEPAEQAKLARFEGQATGLGGKLLGRDDLVSADTGIRFADGVLLLEPLQLTTPAGTFTGLWRARPLEEAPARLDLAGFMDAQAARNLAAAMWPRLKSFAGEEATGPEEWPAVSGAVDLKLGMDIPADPAAEPVMAWSAASEKLTVRPVDVIADFEFSGAKMNGDATHASITGGEVRGPGVQVTPRLDVLLEEGRTRVTGSLQADHLYLDELQLVLAPPVETAQAMWGVSVAHAAEEMWVPPAELEADVQLGAREVLASGHRLKDVSARATLKEQQLNVGGMNASLGTGKVTGTAAVDYRNDPPQWNTDVHAQDVPASVLLEPDAPKLAGALQTALSGDFTFAGPLSNDPDAALKALSGKFSLASAAGSLMTEPVVGDQISKFVGQYAPKWKRLAFDALDAELTVDQGDVLFDRLLLSGETKVNAQGKVSLDGRSDYRLDIVLPKSATPDVGSLQPVVDLLRADDGTFPFAVKVTGPAAKPKVEIDLDALRKRAEEKGRDELEDKVKDAAKGFLDKLKGGK